MFTRKQLMALLLIVVADDIRTRIMTHKMAQLYVIAAEGFEETQLRHEYQIEYLCDMLNKNDIPADEFDMIALYNPIPIKKHK